MNDSKKTVRLITPKFRVSFPQVFVPKAIDPTQPAKYSIQMLFDKVFENPKDQELWNNMKDALKGAIAAKWPDAANRPKNIRIPFRDGAEKEGFEGYGADVVFMNASSKDKPGIVDQNKNVITDPSQFYAGCYARATLTVYAYTKVGNNGISFGLQNLQFMGNGNPFAGRKKASEDFDIIEGVDEIAEGIMGDSGEDLLGDF